MKPKLFLTLFLIVISLKAVAQPGTIDPSFNPIDNFNLAMFSATNNFGTNGNIYTTANLSDGKIIVAGQFTTYNGTFCNSIARLNSEGYIDPTFNLGTGTNAKINSIGIQSDGKIIMVGQFTTYSGTSCNYIARLNSDGTLDSSFNAGTNDKVSTVKIQNDGKIIIGGYFTTCNGNVCNNIARLNSDGTLDTTFSTGADNVVSTISIQSDGKIIIGGQFNFYNGDASNYIARLNSDGTLDNTFNSGAGADNFINTTTIQSDGKIIIGGSFTNFNATSRNFIARLNTNGSLDTSFNPGSGSNQPILCVSIQSDGKIILGGNFTTYNGTSCNRIVRTNSSGVLDATFNIGSGSDGIINSISIQNDSKIICGGSFTTFNNSSYHSNIMRLIVNGTIDTSFNPYTGANGNVYTISIQSDDKIIIGGAFKTYNGIASKSIARLNADGTLDSTFNVGTGFDIYVRSSAIQSDGKILVGGDFAAYNGINKNGIVRLNTDGTLDLTFNSPSEGVTIRSISIQSDGKIIIGGQFTTYNGISRSCSARLNNDGTLDTTFNPGTATSSAVYATKIQNNGKILIGGSFGITRVNINGTIDAAFYPATSGAVLSIAVQSDNKIIIGGNFTQKIARLYSDGTLDNSFSFNYNSFSGNVNSITIQNDGKIISTSTTTMNRLNIDGSLDSTFNNLNSYRSNSAKLQSDGKIIICGPFGVFGEKKHSVARLYGGTSLTNPEFEKENIVIYPNPTQNNFHIDFEKEFTGTIYDITGKSLLNVNTKDIDVSSLSPGIYLLDIISDNKRYTKKIIKQ